MGECPHGRQFSSVAQERTDLGETAPYAPPGPQP